MRYRTRLRALVARLQALTLRALFGGRADSGVYTVRILYGSAFKNETYTTREAAEDRARAIAAQGYPVEVFPPGPLPPLVADPIAAFGEVRVTVGSALTDKLLAKYVEGIGTSTNRTNLRKLGNSLGVSLKESDPKIAVQLDAFAASNAGLIKSLATEQVEDLLPRILAARDRGDRVEDIRAMIQERYRVSRSRADLLARDQILKLNGQITKARHSAAGVTRYIWSTSKDERVRPEHAALNGQVFSWDVPPAVGHPGQDYQCRCVAVPVIGDDYVWSSS